MEEPDQPIAVALFNFKPADVTATVLPTKKPLTPAVYEPVIVILPLEVNVSLLDPLS